MLITGGGSGIGFEFAKTFSDYGAYVIIAGRNEKKLTTAVAALKNAAYVVADVSDDTDAKNLADMVKK